jgi:serine/threonine protein kinase
MAMNGRGATSAALQKYRLDDVWKTGKTLGRGSYATVVEVKYKGLICAAKKIYPILYEDGIGNLVSRFEQECKLLTNLRHPHIVQFVGIWFDPEMSHVPVLVMEFLPTTLAECVERYGRQIPEEITYSIFRDVALGLRYLHERPNPIIHRDLSANNVLLTSDMRAKISDLGVAKILHLDPKKMLRMTKGPGTPSYMPPEATKPNPVYDTKVDIFSYGVMMVHVFSGEWPEPGENVVCSDTESLRAVSEAGRRKK